MWIFRSLYLSTLKREMFRDGPWLILKRDHSFMRLSSELLESEDVPQAHDHSTILTMAHPWPRRVCENDPWDSWMALRQDRADHSAWHIHSGIKFIYRRRHKFAWKRVKKNSKPKKMSCEQNEEWNLKSKHFSRHIRNAADAVCMQNKYMCYYLSGWRCVGRMAGHFSIATRTFNHSFTHSSDGAAYTLGSISHCWRRYTYCTFIIMYDEQWAEIEFSAATPFSHIFPHSNHTLFRSFCISF